jgi:uncharacterized membrane protein
MAGPAIVAQAAGSKRLNLRDTPLEWLGSGNCMRTSALLAVGELITDKLPSTPGRLNAPSLIVRAASGAICGYAVCGKERSRHDKWASAVVGASAALAASLIGYAFRKHTKLPPMVAALAEDAIALGAGNAVIAVIGK